MIALNEYLGGKVNKRKRLIPHDKEELKSIIEQRLKKSPDLNLNDIDVYEIEDMKELFKHMNIKTIDISGWDIDVIDDYMFWSCTNLKSVILPDSIKSIGYNAFEFCRKLPKINIPDSVESMGCWVFNGCISLTEINIPNSVKSIGKYAFTGCSKLTEINIPDLVKNVEDGTFHSCNNLTKINIPDSVESIGKYAFDGCCKLTDINIPDSVEIVGKNAFDKVPHIIYYGPAMWGPDDEYWGAKSIN